MKSIFAIAATALMLVSVTQATPTNVITKSMGIKLDGNTDPFAMNGFKLTGKESNIKDVHYIEGNIRPELKPKRNEKHIILLSRDQFLLPKNIKCYILPLQKCSSTYKTYSKTLKELEVIKKVEWYCFTEEKDDYKVFILNFDNTIPVNKGLINVQNTNEFILQQILKNSVMLPKTPI
ncbi:hypothetical protein BDF19DRAFT_416414 [Syncephalis fuscata]|nr:hypothetical protein BDF19DRAFT_416414 [Syncephalis fuscata]